MFFAVVALPAASGASTGYAWPVKPFHGAHPIRGAFGDPRTLFRGPPTRATLYSGSGTFSFHVGVDISAPDATPVYPVRSGTVHLSGARTVTVRSADGTSWQYWHIVPSVREGASVAAYRTVLGRVRRSYEHVHFAEFYDGRPVNPLSPGHLTPYADRTPPSIGPIQFRRPGSAVELLPELVRGQVEVVVAARDDPRPQAPGMWAGLATVPALVTWRVERARDHRVVLAERAVFDARTHLPARDAFWQVYARGTRQNMATFREHRYWYEDGVFLFRLGVLDTRALRDGIYAVVAEARDSRGNAASVRRVFLTWNRRGWPPKTPQG